MVAAPANRARPQDGWRENNPPRTEAIRLASAVISWRVRTNAPVSLLKWRAGNAARLVHYERTR